MSLNSSGNVLLRIRDASNESGSTVGPTTSSTVSLNQWSHVVGVVDSINDSHTIYINGVLSATSTSAIGAFGSGTPDSIYIGSDVSDFTGFIDEVRVSKSVRYAANFTPSRSPYVADSQTHSLWHFDEGSGQYLLDSSGNNNYATLHSSSAVSTSDPTWSTDGAVSTVQEVPRFLPHGHALSFTDSNSWVRNSNQIITSGAFTVDLWFMLENFTSTRTLFAQGPTTGSNITIQTTTTPTLQFMVDGTTVATGSTTLSTRTWYHVALVYDPNAPTKSTLYLNGNKEATQNVVVNLLVGQHMRLLLIDK
jgi:hypothetical protein